jgi:hypothetical protein
MLQDVAIRFFNKEFSKNCLTKSVVGTLRLFPFCWAFSFGLNCPPGVLCRLDNKPSRPRLRGGNVLCRVSAFRSRRNLAKSLLIFTPLSRITYY